MNAEMTYYNVPFKKLKVHPHFSLFIFPKWRKLSIAVFSTTEAIFFRLLEHPSKYKPFDSSAGIIYIWNAAF